jgi:thiol-disulfide isomerase/thioredoxin
MTALVAARKPSWRRDCAAGEGKGDGKAGDDLIVALVLSGLTAGAPSLLRMAIALAAGRYNTALFRVREILVMLAPFFAIWLVTSAVYWLFLRSLKRPAAELGARVTTAFVLGSLVMTPIQAHYEGTTAFVLRSLVWLWAALLFGLVLREALEESGDATMPAPSLRVVAFFAIGCLLQLHQGWRHLAADVHIDARAGAVAPSVDLPLLGGGRLQTEGMHGRSVVLGFWATWCGPCLAELPVLQKLYQARGADSPLFYAIDVDEAGPERERLVRGVVGRLGLTFPVALDDGHASAAYSVATIPSLAKIGPDGKLGTMLDRPADEEELRDLLLKER